MGDYEDEDSRTVFCANLSDKVTEALLFELFLQVKTWQNQSLFISRTSISKTISGRPCGKSSTTKRQRRTSSCIRLHNICKFNDN